MIIDDNYNIVSEYLYDAYGKCYNTKNINDISYLDYQVLGDLNLFTYCNNNLIMNIDPEGNIVISISSLIIGATIGAYVGVGASVISQGLANAGYSNLKIGKPGLEGVKKDYMKFLIIRP